MVSDNQLDQYFKFVKDMLLEEFISEPLIHSAYYVKQNLPTIYDITLQKLSTLQRTNRGQTF